MKHIIGSLAALLPLLVWTHEARSVELYLQIGTGAFSRDIIEEDPDIVGFKFKGAAGSTRLIAKAGLEIDEVVNLYLQGGGADLSIDEFDNYDAPMKGMYGGGLRINLYRAPYRDGLTLFVEGNALRFTAEDRVEIELACSLNNGCPADTALFLPRSADETIQWNEYTVLLGASGRYFNIRPYGGVRLSRVDGKDRVRAAADGNFTTPFQVDPDIKEADNFGIFFGLDVFVDRSEKTALNFEVSLIDQDSFQAAIRRAF